jgi:hypothetical protein
MAPTPVSSGPKSILKKVSPAPAPKPTPVYDAPSLMTRTYSNNNDANSTNVVVPNRHAARRPNLSLPSMPKPAVKILAPAPAPKPAPAPAPKPAPAPMRAVPAPRKTNSVVPTFAKTEPGPSGPVLPKLKLAPAWYLDLPERRSVKMSPAEKARDKAIERVYALAGSGPEVTAAEEKEQAARKEIEDAQVAVLLSTAEVLGGDAETMRLDDVVELIPTGSQFYMSKDAKWFERMWKQYKRKDEKPEYTPEEMRFYNAAKDHADAIVNLEREKKLAAMGYKRPAINVTKKKAPTRKANNNNNSAARKNLNALSNYVRKTLRKRK